MDILFLIGGCCNEVNLRIADFADRYIIAAAKQFKVNDILNGMTAVTIAETQQIIAKSDVDDIILSERAEKCLRKNGAADMALRLPLSV